MKAFLPEMIKNNKGHIVSIASAASYAGCPKIVDYCASKHAVAGFIEALQLELNVCIFLNLYLCLLLTVYFHFILFIFVFLYFF